jgi:hypothetical protein
MKTLCHELSHNVHSEHDGDFYRLMREIETDVREENKSRDRSQSTGGVARIADDGDVGSSGWEEWSGGGRPLGD